MAEVQNSGKINSVGSYTTSNGVAVEGNYFEVSEDKKSTRVDGDGLTIFVPEKADLNYSGRDSTIFASCDPEGNPYSKLALSEPEFNNIYCSSSYSTK